MYTVHFLEGDTTLTEEAQESIERSVEKVYQKVHTHLNLEECEILVSINTKKIPNEAIFLGSSCEENAMYLFTNADTLHRNLTESNNDLIQNHAMEHCCRGLYTTARTKHIGLDIDCGLLEEVIGEGLAEIFAREIMEKNLKNSQNQHPEEEIKQLWEKIKNESKQSAPNSEKWFRGSQEENIPPLSAYTVGQAIADAYLNTIKKKSFEVLTVPAKIIAERQNRY